MRPEIIDYISKITEEEQYALEKSSSFDKKRYSKSGRFIIERRRMSQMSFGDYNTPVCLIAHPRFQEFPEHSHDYIEIMYVCNGSITHVFEKEKVCLHADEMIVLGKNAKHAIMNTGENDIGINLVISSELFESLFYSMRQNSQLRGQALEMLFQKNSTQYLLFSAKESIALRALMESIISTVFCEKNTDGFLLQQSLSLLLSHLACLLDRKSERKAVDQTELIKKKVLDYIHTSYSSATLTEAAKMLGFSAPYLSNRIHEIFGQNFKDLLMQERFITACELLCTTELPINEITARVGYQNISYFHKQFKNRYEMTPNAYRIKHRTYLKNHFSHT